jgi:NAD(P)-dependent dehydrogenase (short-subunit alcohol dehydrogenase family)
VSDSRPQGSEFDLTGRIVVLTGAAGLIGSEVADVCASYGAVVVLTDILPEREMKDAASKLGEVHGGKSLGLHLDVTSDESVRSAFAEVDDEFGRVDVLVNLAAIDAKLDAGSSEINPTRFEDYPIELWDRSVAVNATGVIRVTQAAVKRMLVRGSGSIINVASTYSLVSPNQSLYKYPGEAKSTLKPVDYVGTKSMIPNLTRYLATLYGRDGIRCNCLVPHGVDNQHEARFRENFTELSPMGRLCDVSELRGPVLLLASDASSYMTGAVLVVDGGWTAW